jgi:hypothetical protein
VKTIPLLGCDIPTSFEWPHRATLLLLASVTALLPLNGVSEPKIVGSRARYPRQLAEYAQVYGRHVWTVKSWVAIGKKAGDLPPLDFPGDMAAWYERHHSQRAPYSLLSSTSSGNFPAKIARPENSPRVNEDLSDLSGLSPEENVGRLRKHLHVAERRLSNALARGDDGTIALCQRSYLLVTEAWRKAEDTLTSLQKTAGEWLSRTDVEAEVVWFLELLRQLHSKMIQRIRSECATQVDQRSLEIVLAVVEERRAQEVLLFQQLPKRVGAAAPDAATLVLDSASNPT